MKEFFGSPVCPKAMHMKVVEVPTTVMLEVMLKVLHLPSLSVSLSNYPTDSLEAANNDAATEAIKYMDRTEHKILKYYNYDELDRKKQTDDSHICWVIENNRKTRDLINKG